MTTLTPNPILIPKESIEGLQFPKEEILSSKEAIYLRQKDIDRAVLLGNNYKGKARIVFEDNIGMKEVETTIWGCTTKWLILKSGLLIPIHRILEIIT